NFDVAVPGNDLITGNKGAANGVDALAFDGNVDGALQWLTARKTADPSRLLGYILDGNLNMTGTLTVGAADVVKISNGAINLSGGHLRADDVSNSGQKVFTSLADPSAGVGCPSALLPGCSGAVAGDWGGLNLAAGTMASARITRACRRHPRRRPCASAATGSCPRAPKPSSARRSLDYRFGLPTIASRRPAHMASGW